MALLADKSADVTSNLVGAPNSQSKTFTMPGGVAIKVESVVATVDNGAASAVSPELTVRDQSGVVIGTHKQGSSIPAGDTGTATFALRLTDSAGTAQGFIKFVFDNVGEWLKIETTTSGAGGGAGVLWNVDAGQFRINLLDAINGALEIFTPLIEIFTANGTFRLLDSGESFFSGTDASWSFSSSWTLDSPQIIIDLTQVGATLDVNNHLGQPIFRVDEDGDLHGKTGKALTFDL